MELKFMKAMTFAVCTTFVMTSCTNDAEENLPSGNPGTTIINARLAAYESLIQAADGENDITDVKAFLFRDGKMTKIYELGAPESENYNLQIDSRSGNLYLLAYTGGTIPTEGLEGTELDETNWKQSIINMPAKTEHFFTGMLALESTGSQTSTASVSLKRGMARFDLAVESIEEVSVKNVTVRNLANSAYLFPQEGIQSPSNANRKDTTVVFQQPITDGKSGMLYVYEQENQSIEISATA
ncbi:hypothetical protein, partial [Bacteroides sp. CAG:633]